MSFIAQETIDKKEKQALYKLQLKNVNHVLSAYKSSAFRSRDKRIKNRQIKHHQLITVKHKTAEIIIQVQAYALPIRVKEKSIFCTFKCMWIINRDDTDNKLFWYCTTCTANWIDRTLIPEYGNTSIS
jgi:hypothetical protein